MTKEGIQIIEQFKNKRRLTLEANKSCWSDLLFKNEVFIHKGGARDFSEQDFDRTLTAEQALDLIKKLFIDKAKTFDKIEISTDKEVLECWGRWPHTP